MERRRDRDTNSPYIVHYKHTIIVHDDNHGLWYCTLACSRPIHKIKVHVETFVTLLNVIVYDLNSNAPS